MSPNNVAALAEEVDIADIIAGALQTSRAHAYELMRSALASQSEEQGKDAGRWLPIDSAPKDGTPIMGCIWNPKIPEVFAPCRIYWATYHPNSKGAACWRSAPICGDILRALTHWAPLPPAPVATPKEGALCLPSGPDTGK